MDKTKTVLMCPPTYFDIAYEINPWMSKANQVEPAEAARQWQKLYDTYVQTLGWDVQIIEPVAGLPDMVFTANGGLVYGGKVILPHFRYPQRQPETDVFKQWFKTAGYQQIYYPENFFEGEGDALIWNNQVLFGGSPFRSDAAVHPEICHILGLTPVTLELVDRRFYHLDTCFTVISDDTVALYPKAFNLASVERVKQLVPHVIEASDEDAVVYGLNAMASADGRIVMPAAAQGLIKQYQQLGLMVLPTAIGEFQKSGGGIKCLTLELR